LGQARGWRRLVEGGDPAWGRDAGLAAYSEFMPAPRLAIRPYGDCHLEPLGDPDPESWLVSEAEEAWELQPGLAHIAAQVHGELADLASGRLAPLIRGHRDATSSAIRIGPLSSPLTRASSITNAWW